LGASGGNNNCYLGGGSHGGVQLGRPLKKSKVTSVTILLVKKVGRTTLSPPDQGKR